MSFHSEVHTRFLSSFISRYKSVDEAESVFHRRFIPTPTPKFPLLLHFTRNTYTTYDLLDELQCVSLAKVAWTRSILDGHQSILVFRPLSDLTFSTSETSLADHQTQCCCSSTYVFNHLGATRYITSAVKCAKDKLHKHFQSNPPVDSVYLADDDDVEAAIVYLVDRIANQVIQHWPSATAPPFAPTWSSLELNRVFSLSPTTSNLRFYLHCLSGALIWLCSDISQFHRQLLYFFWSTDDETAEKHLRAIKSESHTNNGFSVSDNDFLFRSAYALIYRSILLSDEARADIQRRLQKLKEVFPKPSTGKPRHLREPEERLAAILEAKASIERKQPPARFSRIELICGEDVLRSHVLAFLDLQALTRLRRVNSSWLHRVDARTVWDKRTTVLASPTLLSLSNSRKVLVSTYFDCVLLFVATNTFADEAARPFSAARIFEGFLPEQLIDSFGAHPRHTTRISRPRYPWEWAWAPPVAIKTECSSEAELVQFCLATWTQLQIRPTLFDVRGVYVAWLPKTEVATMTSAPVIGNPAVLSLLIPEFTVPLASIEMLVSFTELPPRIVPNPWFDPLDYRTQIEDGSSSSFCIVA